MSTTLETTVKLLRDDTRTTTGRTVTLTIGDYRQAATIPVGTGEVTIAVDSAITDAGLMYCRNHTDPDVDPDNYVDIGYTTSVYPNRLYAGESALIPLATTTAAIYVVASDAATKFQYEITERA
jgi:hypothetical protein